MHPTNEVRLQPSIHTQLQTCTFKIKGTVRTAGSYGNFSWSGMPHFSPDYAQCNPLLPFFVLSALMYICPIFAAEPPSLSSLKVKKKACQVREGKFGI